MKITAKITAKRMYNCPEIFSIKLDNEISLVLESNPPIGPDEGISFSPGYLKLDPFKTYQG